MAEYYFLASLLPPLEIGHVPTLNFAELKALLAINLNKKDASRVKRFLRMIDFENMRRIFSHEPIDPRGNLTEEELKVAIAEQSFSPEEEFPEYLIEFLEKYRTDEERNAHFSFLMSNYLRQESENENGFLCKYFSFERYLRMVLAGFRAKKLNKNIEEELQYEDSADPIVAQVIAQKDAKSYEPPFEFKELKPLFDTYADEPLELHKALVAYRFNEIIEMVESEHFSLDRILGFMARLLLVEKWLELDMEGGLEIIDKIERKIT
jgi:hypothetical protein